MAKSKDNPTAHKGVRISNRKAKHDFQISEVVESRFGYHVIRLTERRAAQPVPLEEVRERLEQVLQQRQRQEIVNAFVEARKAEGNVEILI